MEQSASSFSRHPQRVGGTSRSLEVWRDIRPPNTCEEHISWRLPVAFATAAKPRRCSKRKMKQKASMQMKKQVHVEVKPELTEKSFLRSRKIIFLLAKVVDCKWRERRKEKGVLFSSFRSSPCFSSHSSQRRIQVALWQPVQFSVLAQDVLMNFSNVKTHPPFPVGKNIFRALFLRTNLFQW